MQWGVHSVYVSTTRYDDKMDQRKTETLEKEISNQYIRYCYNIYNIYDFTHNKNATRVANLNLFTDRRIDVCSNS